MPEWISIYLNATNPYFYPSVFFALYLSGIGAPISADLVFLTVGYLAYQGHADYRILVPLGVVAIIATDTTLFFIARKFGRKVLSFWPFRKMITTERLNTAEASYRNYGYRMIFFARFMPGIRTVFVFTGGLLRLDYRKFILHDFLGGAVAIPCTIYSVKWVAGNLDGIHSQIQKAQWFVLTAIGLIIGFILFKKHLRKI